MGFHTGHARAFAAFLNAAAPAVFADVVHAAPVGDEEARGGGGDGAPLLAAPAVAIRGSRSAPPPPPAESRPPPPPPPGGTPVAAAVSIELAPLRRRGSAGEDDGEATEVTEDPRSPPARASPVDAAYVPA